MLLWFVVHVFNYVFFVLYGSIYFIQKWSLISTLNRSFSLSSALCFSSSPHTVSAPISLPYRRNGSLLPPVTPSSLNFSMSPALPSQSSPSESTSYVSHLQTRPTSDTSSTLTWLLSQSTAPYTSSSLSSSVIPYSTYGTSLKVPSIMDPVSVRKLLRMQPMPMPP